MGLKLPRGTPLYNTNRYMPPERTLFLSAVSVRKRYGFRGNYESVWKNFSFKFQTYYVTKKE